MNNPYKNCPVYETQSFILRLVSEDDAENLLACYSDPQAHELFNIDNFPTDCKFNTVGEMHKYIKFWLMEYEQEAYIRFVIVDKSTNKAVGTIEMFGMVGQYKTDVGILRLDIASRYEKGIFLRACLKSPFQRLFGLFSAMRRRKKALRTTVRAVFSYGT